MKPLDFRSFFEEEARFAVFSTYEFDPVHFEKYLLWTKALGRARRIIVMVDAGRFQKLMAESRTPARSLNEHYLVLPVRRSGGVFHPKLALLLGEKHAEVICGSNNLTQPGSTHNLELLNRVPVRVEDGERDVAHLALVREAIQFFKGCTAHGEAHAARIALKWLNELEEDFRWLGSIHDGGVDGGPVLVHTLRGGLWEWMTARIGKERPQKIQVISPFYDSDLALLKRVRERWPDCPVEVTAQQHSSNLPPEVLRRLRKGVRLFDLPNEDSRRLHAKLVAVSVNGRSLCLAGSANFTEAAFDGGNVETCLAWEADGDVVKPLFQNDFSRKAIAASEFEPGEEQPPSEDSTPAPPLRVKSCVLDEGGRLSVGYSVGPELGADSATIALKHYSEREPVFTRPVRVTPPGLEEFVLPPELSGGFSGAVLCYLLASKGGVLHSSVPMWLIQEHKLTHEPTEGGGGSGREAEVRETGRGLVEHLDEVGHQRGQTELIRKLMELNIRYQDESRWGGKRRGFRVKVRDPFHPDTMPEWLKAARQDFPQLEQAIYDFADRHQRHVLEKHERKGNINGLSNFIDVMVASSKLLFVYLRRGVVKQNWVTPKLSDYLKIFTGTLPEYRDEEPTGYLGRVFTNRRGEPVLLGKIFDEHNVAGHLEALLLVAQVVRCGGRFDANRTRRELSSLADRVEGFERRIGLARATAARVRKALEDYEMLTDEELALWTKGFGGPG
jgi:hypothetical protein